MLLIQQLFAGLFIVVSGVSCRLSKNNIKRGVRLLFFALAISYVHLLIIPDEADFFWNTSFAWSFNDFGRFSYAFDK